MSTKEDQKEDLLKTPSTPQGLFGDVVSLMQKRFEERKREDVALKLCLQRRALSVTPPAHCQPFAQVVVQPFPRLMIPQTAQTLSIS